MSLLQLKRDGWFDDEDSVDLDLTEIHKKRLLAGEKIEVYEKGSPRLYEVSLIPTFNKEKLEAEDIRLSLIDGRASATGHAVYVWINGEKQVSSRGSWFHLKERDVVKVGTGPERTVKVSDRYFIGHDFEPGAKWQFMTDNHRPVDKPSWYVSKDTMIGYLVLGAIFLIPLACLFGVMANQK